MCIDKLEIKFEEPRGGLGHQYYNANRRNVDGGIASDPRRIDVDDIRQSLVTAGYGLSEVNSGRGRRFYTLLHVLNENGERIGVTIRGKNDTRPGRDTAYAYVNMIVANPARFTRWEDFWAVILAMDGMDGANRVIQRGYIHRIDYACDYHVQLQTVMHGLYVSRSQTLLAYDDFSDDPYGEYRWNAGIFYSFKIGSGNKSLKVYDKGREELKRFRRLERSTAELLGEALDADDADPDDYPENDDEEDDDDLGWFSEGNALPERELRVRLEALRGNIAQLQRFPRTRIELSLKTPAVIRDAWGEALRPALSTLPHHLERIQFGHYTPFRGVLLNTIETRGVHLEKRTLEAQHTRHEVHLGFLMNVAKRMGSRRFWTQHRRYFEIYPWNIQAQPTAVFKARLRQWTSSEVGLTSLGAVIMREQLRSSAATPQTRRWPVELSHCTIERMASGGRLPL